jgi:hypothetical protein
MLGDFMVNKVGRPKKDGWDKGEDLIRLAFIQESFMRHRAQPEKYDSAINAVIEDWYKETGETISSTTVKRALAETMPNKAENLLIASKPMEDTCDEFGRKLLFEFKEGKRPQYPHPTKKYKK